VAANTLDIPCPQTPVKRKRLRQAHYTPQPIYWRAMPPSPPPYRAPHGAEIYLFIGGHTHPVPKWWPGVIKIVRTSLHRAHSRITNKLCMSIKLFTKKFFRVDDAPRPVYDE